MDDWRENARQLSIEYDEAQEIGAMQKRKTHESELAVKEKAKSVELSRRFKCIVCGVGASKPGVGFDAPNEGGGYWCYDDWGTPGDLWQCKICGKWACAEHYEAGICKRCAEWSADSGESPALILSLAIVVLVTLLVVVLLLV